MKLLCLIVMLDDRQVWIEVEGKVDVVGVRKGLLLLLQLLLLRLRLRLLLKEKLYI